MEETLQMLMYHVMHLYRQRSVELLKKMDIHPGQAGLLWELSRSGGKYNGMSQRELADVIGVKPPSITVMLRKLEAEEYIQKCPDEKDQRISRIFLTEKGKHTALLMDEILGNLEMEVFGNMNEEEVCVFRRLLSQMRDNLRRTAGKEDQDGKII